MFEIIPAIIAKNFFELRKKIKKIEPYVRWVQLDIMDGLFVENATWREPRDLKNLETGLNLEAHLMIERPEESIDAWIKSGVKRIIFHYEATDKGKEIIAKIKKAGLEAGLAVNPETPLSILETFFGDLVLKWGLGSQKIDLVSFLTVQPGRGGQKFIEDVFDKIRSFRQVYPDIKIEADGGINLETAKKAVEAGADILVSGSYIFGAENTQQAIKDLKKI